MLLLKFLSRKISPEKSLDFCLKNRSCDRRKGVYVLPQDVELQLKHLWEMDMGLIIKNKTRQNGRQMTSFRGAMAELGTGVDNELGGSGPHQFR